MKKFSNKSFLFLFIVVMLATVICSCGNNETPKETEPPVVTDEPAVTTEAPVVTEPPVVTTEAPVVTEPPVVTTEAPVVTEPPVVTTEAPVVTEPPVVTTEAPAVTTPVEVSYTIPYKAEISFELKDADGDGVYTADDIFGAANTYVFAEKGAGYLVGSTDEAEKVNKIETTVSYAWDGEFIYAYVVAKDPTLFAVGEDIAQDPNKNWSYDGIELWYLLGTAPTEKAEIRQFWASRLGYALNAQPSVKSANFDGIAWDCKVNTETNTSYLLIKIPAKTEAGVALVGGDKFYTAIQIDDNRSEDNSFYYCATFNPFKIENYDEYTLANAD